MQNSSSQGRSPFFERVIISHSLAQLWGLLPITSPSCCHRHPFHSHFTAAYIHARTQPALSLDFIQAHIPGSGAIAVKMPTHPKTRELIMRIATTILSHCANIFMLQTIEGHFYFTLFLSVSTNSLS